MQQIGNGKKIMIDANDFSSQIFQTYEINEHVLPSGLHRVPKGIPLPPHDHIELRKQIQELVLAKANDYRIQSGIKMSDYDVIELHCRIPSDTLKKTISGRCNLTRNFLAKFSVGLKLDVCEANKLFLLHSGDLNLTNAFDFIVYHALISRDGIESFCQEVFKYIGIKLDRDGT